MKDRRINSICEADLKDLRMPIIAVYKSPEDYPGYYVARIYDMNKPTDVVMLKKTLTEIEIDIRKNTNMIFMSRGKTDVGSLIGVWM